MSTQGLQGFRTKCSTTYFDGIYYQQQRKCFCVKRVAEEKIGKSKVLFCRWRAKFNLETDSRLLMLLLVAIVGAVIISDNAVLAAQRDSVRHKNTNKVSSNANAIPTESEGLGSVVSVSGSNTNLNRYNNDNTDGNERNYSSESSVENSVEPNGVSNDATSAVINTPITTTATVVVSSNSSSPIYSGGIQKNSATFSSGAPVINRNAIEVSDDIRNRPYFEKSASKNVTALLGKTAYLNCRVKNLGNKTMLLQVSWVRHRDIHLLTVGRYTYTSDQRFRAIHQPQTEDWILQIKYPQHRDSGIYECQVSTTPHMSHYIHLNVVEPSTEIIGAPDLYIESGSTINLTCVILNSPEPPAYIFWNHNNAIINYDSPRGGVSVVTNKGETTTSFLLIKSARPSDSGHYQCNPSNAKPKGVTVHVLNGVSHSVSRGIPSSNAARGSSASSNVPHLLSPSVPFNALVQFGVYQVVHATIDSGWVQDKINIRHLVTRLLSTLALLATELLGKRQTNRRKLGIYNDCCCHCSDLRRNKQLRQKRSISLAGKQIPEEIVQRSTITSEKSYCSLKNCKLQAPSIHFNQTNVVDKKYWKEDYGYKCVLLNKHPFEPDIR